MPKSAATLEAPRTECVDKVVEEGSAVNVLIDAVKRVATPT
jgi:hypothetical protein